VLVATRHVCRLMRPSLPPSVQPVITSALGACCLQIKMRVWLIDWRLQSRYPIAMVNLFLWIGVGAVVGSLVGAYYCAEINRALPKHGHAVHTGICAAAGAVGGSLIFLLTGGLFFAQSLSLISY
jgi:hypothetical protein